MRMKTITTLLATAMTFSAAPLLAGTWDGTVKVGGVVVDEEGDLSTVQETYNIHDGFNISEILLSGSPNPDNYFRLNLHDVNLDDRRGDFLYRRPGMLRLTGSFDQSRQVFDPDRAVTSDRKDWHFGARLTPVMWLQLAGHYNLQTRKGDRLSYPGSSGTPFPGGTESSLGNGYDYTLNTGGVSAEVRKDRRGLGLDFRASDFADDMNPDADRTGTVFSARAWSPCLLYDKLTHLVRFAYGKHNLANQDLDYTLTKFQYTGVVRPLSRFEFKYNFDAQRVDDQSTDLQTDRFQNVVDATFYHANGSVFAGYGYETNDDDDQLTSYQTWRAGTTIRTDMAMARIRYSGRIKDDQEDLTLLKDVESSLLRADVQVKPVTGLDLSAGFNRRDREFPDINVEAEGKMATSTAGYTYPGWGRLSGTYTYTQDEYRDRAGNYAVNSHTVTARADFERIKDLRLSSGVTFLKAGKDLDIEKSILFFEGLYTVQNDLHFEVKYNIYNYDDFILLDRYYTANVVWFNVAYDLHGE